MAPLISAQGLSKRFGTAPLFKNIPFIVSEGDRIALIGPNGSGKSTLLAILQGRIKPDTGDVSPRKGTTLTCVEQVSEFAPGDTIRSVIENALTQASVRDDEQQARFAETLGRAGFADFDGSATALSGGWRKRLAIAAGLVTHPDILLLDEPTNHLDIAGIKWLETFLQSAPFACVVVSHDRYFLENVANEVVELDRAYPDGFLRVRGHYSAFLEAKEEFLRTQQKQQDALANRVHTEIEWLRRGPKARTTKSKARIGKANELIGELADMKTRSHVATANIDFSASGRQTKQLIVLDDVSYSYGERNLMGNLQFTFTSGMRVGLVGPNGSGKTTLLRLLQSELEPTRGQIQKAEALRIVSVNQNRELDPDLSLRRALAPDSDSVIYQDRVIHVAAWAAKFLFKGEDLNRPVGKFSGGERARILIAQLMLQPADVLLLDEPTNDLDIPTLEILEESLLEFRGALVLVTHDRYMLDRVSTIVLGFDGLGGIERFADYSQWDSWQREQQRSEQKAARQSAQPAAIHLDETKKKSGNDAVTAMPGAGNGERKTAKSKLSFAELKEFAALEKRIADGEQELRDQRAMLESPAVTSDPVLLRDTCVRLDQTQKNVDALYARWSDLEQKAKG